MGGRDPDLAAAQAGTKTKAPGGPTASPVHSHTATTATAETDATAIQPAWADQAPIVTAAASATAMMADCRARLA